MARLYTKKVWFNDQTKLSAKNLNHIEKGIEAVAEAIDEIKLNLGVIDEDPVSENNSILNSLKTPGVFTFTYQSSGYLLIVDEIAQGIISQTLIYTISYHNNDNYQLIKFTRTIDDTHESETTVSVSAPAQLCTTEYVDRKIENAITSTLTKEY